ncbi:hypothetical protein [Corallococcus sp. Z5C101001]|uniref:hypothetical protein n=1 Tax=Corallococcus sp. Z5C101001 TaxID=2596829 RepID=UPI00117D7D2B|nr:hypothetical protein [Corallococcus sp. Z5C101001]TSC31488.1 hypothetical protein FOF48_12510 [Corallococcus sp. Z5C101001]
MSKTALGSWQRIRDSLDGYEPEKLIRLLREYLTPQVPPGTRKLTDAQHDAMAKHIQRLLEQNLGPWYTETGVFLGNESIGGYCWCHRFFRQKPTPNMSVEYNIQLMIDALERSREWLFKLDARFEALRRDLPSAPDDTDIRMLALADGLVATLDITIQATACEEAWYGFADRALGWMFDALGLRPGYQAGKLMNKLFAFESWHAPPLEELRDSAEKVAAAVVEDEGRRHTHKR